MTSGKIDINGSAKNIELRTTSGDINLNNSILPSRLYVDVTSGDVKVSIPENDGFDVEYKVTSGDFKTDFDIYSKMNDGNRKNGVGKYKDGGDTFNFKITSGTIKLYKN